MKRLQNAFLLSVFLLAILSLAAPLHANSPIPEQPLSTWQQIIRQTPYWQSQGVHSNLSTLRRWVLTGSSFCEKRERHILFDKRATFLAYLNDASDEASTQNNLNQLREQWVQDKRSEQWLAGSADTIGYPFALSCKQPDANLYDALARYRGDVDEARLWGTWDGMSLGSPEKTLSLHEALQAVYRDRTRRGMFSFPETVLATLAGKILIESGARPRAHSAADARGIMQLSQLALKDCELDEKFYFHRMAQIDCAFKLMEQNHRNLQTDFQTVFSALPEQKAQELYTMLLLQAYHGGIGRVRKMLSDPILNAPALYFAAHSERFSAGDMAIGMVYHNLGREQLGFASLYYTVDVSIARDFACEKISDLLGCTTD